MAKNFDFAKVANCTSKEQVLSIVGEENWEFIEREFKTRYRVLVSGAQWRGDVTEEEALKNRKFLWDWINNNLNDSGVKDLLKFYSNVPEWKGTPIYELMRQHWGGSGRMGAPTITGNIRPQCQYLWSDIERFCEKLSKLYRKAKGGLPPFSNFPSTFRGENLYRGQKPKATVKVVVKPQPTVEPTVKPQPQPQPQPQPTVEPTVKKDIITLLDLLDRGILGKEEVLASIRKLVQQ